MNANYEVLELGVVSTDTQSTGGDFDDGGTEGQNVAAPTI